MVRGERKRRTRITKYRWRRRVTITGTIIYIDIHTDMESHHGIIHRTKRIEPMNERKTTAGKISS
jgi:hypothetical protein